MHFLQFGHAYEAVRYLVKGSAQKFGSQLGYAAGGIAGIFSPEITVKNGAAQGAAIGLKVVGAPFVTRNLHNYAQAFVPGQKKFVYYPAKLGPTYL